MTRPIEEGSEDGKTEREHFNTEDNEIVKIDLLPRQEKSLCNA